MRTPDSSAPRPVNSDSVAPTANSASAVSDRGDRQRVERRRRRRTAASGIAGADGERKKRRHRRSPGRAELVGVEAELLARERVERVLGVGDQPLGESARLAGGRPFARVDQRKLLRLGVGILGQLLALEPDLVFEQFALRAHRNEFAGGHRECAGGQAGDAGQHDHSRVGVGAGDAENQARVGHQAVVDSEHRRAQIAAAAQAAMPALDAAGAPA